MKAEKANLDSEIAKFQARVSEIDSESTALRNRLVAYFGVSAPVKATRKTRKSNGEPSIKTQVIEYLKNGKSASASDIATALKVKAATINATLSAAKSKGEVTNPERGVWAAS